MAGCQGIIFIILQGLPRHIHAETHCINRTVQLEMIEKDWWDESGIWTECHPMRSSIQSIMMTVRRDSKGFSQTVSGFLSTLHLLDTVQSTICNTESEEMDNKGGIYRGRSPESARVRSLICDITRSRDDIEEYILLMVNTQAVACKVFEIIRRLYAQLTFRSRH